jgi:GNAT superfamily N-acetyltransferase
MNTIMNEDAFAKKGYSISTDNTLIDFQTVYNYLENDSYWSKGVTSARLKKAIENSMCFGVYYQLKQAGFARVVTDEATFAYICDVFIMTDHRRLGLSKWLIQTILQHPDLQGLRRWSLETLDAHGLYAQFGFTTIVRPERWMEIHTPYQLQDQGGEK